MSKKYHISPAYRESILRSVQSKSRTWHSCFQCHYSHVDLGQCRYLSDSDRMRFPLCSKTYGFNMLDVSNYAAQLAWWLAFFPPERFIVVSSQELRNEESRIKVMPTCACICGFAHAN
jgi:hypothetical protein